MGSDQKKAPGTACVPGVAFDSGSAADEDLGETVFFRDGSDRAVFVKSRDGLIHLFRHIGTFAEGNAVLLFAEVVVKIDDQIVVIRAFAYHGKRADAVNDGKIRRAGLTSIRAFAMESTGV